MHTMETPTVDLETVAKETLVSGLEIAFEIAEVPVVGNLVAALLNVLWPEHRPSVWDQIQAQVEQLVDQKLNDLETGRLNNAIEGLQNALSDYVKVQDDNTAAPAQFEATKTVFDAQLPTFKSSPGQEILALPQLAQAATLYFGLLREGIQRAPGWGFTDETVQGYRQDLAKYVMEYTNWVNQWVADGYRNLKLPDGDSDAGLTAEQWATQNRYLRSMTTSVLDNAVRWHEFDPTLFPPGSPVSLLGREIFSDPLGLFADLDPGVDRLPYPRLTHVRLASDDNFLGSLTATYGTRASRMIGVDRGGARWEQDLTQTNLVEASGHSGDVVDRLSLTVADGTSSPGMGGNGGSPFDCRFDSHVMSSFSGVVSSFYGAAGCLIIGFRRQEAFPANGVNRVPFLTASADERDQAVNAGVGVYEGVSFWAPQVEFGTEPLYRATLYEGGDGPSVDRFYTTVEAEIDTATAQGYKAEGVCCYVWATEVIGTVPLYRFYCKPLYCHYYTISELEHELLSQRPAWKLESVVGYVYPARPDTLPDTVRNVQPVFRMSVAS